MEFLRRFVQHILPRGFVRIRQSGFLANTCRTSCIARARTVLTAPAAPASTANEAPPAAITATSTRATWTCPHCGAAMIVDPILSAVALTSLAWTFDTS
jgi:hypothetical protein